VTPRRAAEHRTALAEDFGFRTSVQEFWFSRTGRTSKDKRTFGKRSPVEGQGSFSEGAVGWKATPELVSQDRERVSQAFGQKRTRLRTPADPSLGAVGAGSDAGPHFF